MYESVIADNLRSPDGQALMLAAGDGYCSIVVFDLAELGTVHPTQQHHRQLAAIANNHSSHPAIPASLSASSVRRDSFSSTPVPHSPAISLMRQSPAPSRSEREGSTSSSIMGLGPSQSLNLPLFVAPSSTSSVSDRNIPTPGEEAEMYNWRLARGGRSGSESSASMSNLGGMGGSGELTREALEKRPSSAQESREGDGQGGEAEQPKKKRRVVLTQLASED